jgi:hypothetical protein
VQANQASLAVVSQAEVEWRLPDFLDDVDGWCASSSSHDTGLLQAPSAFVTTRCNRRRQLEEAALYKRPFAAAPACGFDLHGDQAWIPHGMQAAPCQQEPQVRRGDRGAHPGVPGAKQK